MFLLILAACTSAPTIPWSAHADATRTSCGWVAGGGDPMLDPTLPGTYPDDACVDAVLADFGVDVDAFLSADALADPYGYVRGDSSLASSGLSTVLAPARALLTLDFGGTHLTANDLVSSAYVDVVADVAAETGAPDLGAALYDFASSVIVATEPVEDDCGRACFDAETRTLNVRQPVTDGWTPGVVLVHEARHYWGSHGDCPDGGGSCDPDASLANGFGLSSMVRLAGRLPTDADPEWRAYLKERIETQMRHILVYLDEDGDLAPEWEDVDPAAY
jgi:hypothetical protein